MKSVRGSTLLQGTLLALTVFGLGYWAWQRYHQPSAPTYEGKTLHQWFDDLSDPNYEVSDVAAEVLVSVGPDAVPILLEAYEHGDIRLHRRAAAALVRIGANSAPGLIAALKGKPKEQRIEVALVRLGSAAVPALREALNEDRSGEAAAHVLGLIGSPASAAVPDLIAVLERQQAPAAFRGEAAFALGRIGEPVGDIVPVLIAALKDRKVEVRRQAADALGWIGPPAREAVPALIAVLKDEEAKVAKRACQALSFIGDARAAPPLLEIVRSDREELHAEAGQALWRLGAKAEQILPSLLSLAHGLKDKTAPARALLASFGPRAVPILVKTLRDDEPARRETAAEVLGRIGPPARLAVPDLLAALQDKSPTVALLAAGALAEIDPTRAGPAVPLLIHALGEPSTALVLANIGPDARAAVPALIASLKPDKDAANGALRRAGTRLALARIGTPAVSALIEALKDKREGVAPLAGEALGWILPPPKQAVPALRQALKSDRPHAGIYAHALGQLGSLAQAAVPDLTELLADPAGRPEAAVALVRIDAKQGEKVVPLLIKDLQETEEKQRQAAVLALARLGPAAAPAAGALVASLRSQRLKGMETIALLAIGAGAVPNLAELLKAPQAEYRRLAVEMLAKIGSASQVALTPLIAALSDMDPSVRVGAAQAVEAIGPEARAALPALLVNLDAPQPQVRAAAASALGRLGSHAAEARRPLLECLLDPDENVRYYSALSLGRIDPHFTEGVPALHNALHDPSPMVQLATMDSLSRIDRGTMPENVPLLVSLSQKPYPLDVRFRAAEGLGNFAPDQAKQAVPWLLTELTDVNPQICNYAARVLAVVDSRQSSGIVLALAAALRTPLAEARPAILQTLGEFGPKAREAVPEIEQLLYDGTPGVREEAIRALRAINPARAKQLEIG